MNKHIFSFSTTTLRLPTAALLLSVASLLLLGSCKKENLFSLSGTVSQELNGQKIFMFDMTAAEPTIVDSTVVANGRFSFSGTVDDPWIAMMGNPESFVVFPVIEPGHIVFADEHCSGTPLNDRYEAFQARMMAITDPQEIAAAYWDLYHQNPDNVLGLQALNDLIQVAEIDYSQLDEILQSADPYIAHHPLMQSNLEILRHMDLSAVGQHYIDIQGTNGKLSDLIDGHVAVVDFYASWCAPCRAAITEFLLPLWELFSDKGFIVVGVNVLEEGTPAERLATFERTTAELGITYPLLCDTTRTSVEAYAIQGIPTILLIDRDGTILCRTSDPLILKDALKEVIQADYIEPLQAK